MSSAKRWRTTVAGTLPLRKPGRRAIFWNLVMTVSVSRETTSAGTSTWISRRVGLAVVVVSATGRPYCSIQQLENMLQHIEYKRHIETRSNRLGANSQESSGPKSGLRKKDHKGQNEMVQIVWEFRVRAGKELAFERHYGPEGTWVQLFRRSPAFVRTDLLRDPGLRGRYLTVDCWKDLAAYDSFKEQFAGEYARVDAEMESLTQNEMKLGVFEAVE